MQQPIVKFFALSYRHCSSCFGHYYAHHQEPVKLSFPYECGGGSVLNWPRLRTLPPPHSYGNQRLQRQFDGLLMMGIVMPETCWAVSVRQSNKILRLIVASSWVFYLSVWRCTEPQTLNAVMSVSSLYRLVVIYGLRCPLFYPFLSFSSSTFSCLLINNK
jgi:hypothetical protein